MATKKPTLAQSIAPNRSVIESVGAAYKSKGFTPVDTIGESMYKIVEPIFAARAEARRKKDAEWDKWLNKLGPDVSPEGLNEKQSEAIRNYTMNARQQYADYFNIVSQPGIDKQSDEYIQALNGMNSITKNFEKLANQKNAYLANQENFIKNKEAGNFSLGSDDLTYNNALEIYGTGADGNGMDWTIENGNIIYNTSNGPVRYEDFKDPFKKDFKGALAIQNLTSRITDSGKKFSQSTGDQLATELNALFAENPNSMKSLIADGTLRGYDFSNITEEDMQGDPGALRNKMVQTIVGQVKSKTDSNYSPQSDTYQFRINDKMSEKRSHRDPKTGIIYDKEVGTNGSRRFIDDMGNEYKGTEPLEYIGDIEIETDTKNTENTSDPKFTYKSQDDKTIQALKDELSEEQGIENPTDEQLQELWDSYMKQK